MGTEVSQYLSLIVFIVKYFVKFEVSFFFFFFNILLKKLFNSKNKCLIQNNKSGSKLN